MAEPAPGRGHRSPFLGVCAWVHRVALVTVVVFPQTWPFVLAALVTTHLSIGAAGMLPRCRWLGPNITRLPAAAARDGLVALTFDDGPDPEVTPAVLDLLEGAGAKATFFCVGQRVEAHPMLVAAIRARGHGVENHSYSHANGFAFRGPRGIAREIRRAQEAIEAAGGGRPRLFRAPAGIRNPWLEPALLSADLSLVSWSRRGYDTVSRDGARVARRLGRGLKAGDILLLHDGSVARDPRGRPVVLEALPRVLEQMRRMGVRSVPLHAALEGGSARP